MRVISSVKPTRLLKKLLHTPGWSPSPAGASDKAKPGKGGGVAMIFQMVRSLAVPIVAAFTLGACTQFPPPPTSTKVIPPVAMSAGTYRPHTLDEYPDFTPEELGRRMLKLIDSIKLLDELSLERVREVMRLPLHEMSSGTSYAFGMNLPTWGWYYVFDYDNTPRAPGLKGVTYRFNNKNESAEMTPVCAMDYNAYVTALTGMGFEEQEGMAQYETYPTLPPRLNERTELLETPPPKFRRLPVYFFTRKNVVVQITRWREADAPDEKLRHACVQSIAVR
ncbi:hypothetical protein [Variovorax ginsengisoli]|uniref:Lipoprotein n=1 Tax=Variovorax ginsengisoli TaxID=363844 RepID=A0ABT9S6Y0_9BURK|nr:hypothetical protein [Variovorax ginsengisoli]MDP9899975.1 hypothetical protein [Variovorax ginsengisoli]